MFVCFENKPIVILFLLLLLFVILIALFSIGKATFQEFGTNQVEVGDSCVQSFLSPGRAGSSEVLCTQPPAQASGRCRWDFSGIALGPSVSMRSCRHFWLASSHPSGSFEEAVLIGRTGNQSLSLETQ